MAGPKIALCFLCLFVHLHLSHLSQFGDLYTKLQQMKVVVCRLYMDGENLVGSCKNPAL